MLTGYCPRGENEDIPLPLATVKQKSVGTAQWGQLRHWTTLSLPKMFGLKNELTHVFVLDDGVETLFDVGCVDDDFATAHAGGLEIQLFE